jgi:hypothetical protein
MKPLQTHWTRHYKFGVSSPVPSSFCRLPFEVATSLPWQVSPCPRRQPGGITGNYPYRLALKERALRLYSQISRRKNDTDSNSVFMFILPSYPSRE